MKTKIFTILLVAFLFRFILLIIDQYITRLPQGGVDTENFDRWAYNIFLYKPYNFIETISNGVKLFSSFGALLYSTFGRYPFIWAFTMLLFGVGTVYNVYRGTFLLTNDYKIADKAAWVVCLFPNIAILSVLVLREAPIHFFLSLSAVHMIKFIKHGNKLSLLYFFLFGLLSTILHSGVIAVFAGFVLVSVFSNPKFNLFGKVLVLLLTCGGLYLINYTGIGLSKFGGSFEGALEQLSEGLDAKDSGAVYPEWLMLSGGFSDFWKLPIRLIAFLFAPLLPFLAKTGRHLIGVIDGLCYFVCFLKIFGFRKHFSNNKMGKAILFVVIMIALAFSLGSSNFGTNIRHRAKIFPLIIMITFIGDRRKNQQKIKRYVR